MKEKIQKYKNNKILKIISNIIYTILFIIVLLMLIIVIMQRTSNNEITLGGYRIFVVATGSMEPKYKVGDVLLSKEVEPEDLKVGDDIVYNGEEESFKGKVVTHQIISIEKEEENYKIITKGIANSVEDPEITQEQVMGKIVYKIKVLSFFEKAVANNYIFFFIIFVPIALLTFKQIRNAIYIEEDEEENDKK